MCFHKYQLTNLYQLDIEGTKKGGSIFTTITGYETEDNNIKIHEFSQLDYNITEKIQDLQHMLMCPNDKDLANGIENNMIGNNGYIHRDVINVKKNIWS